MNEAINLSLSPAGRSQVPPGLWSLNQAGQNPFPARLVLEYPPDRPKRRTSAGAVYSVLDPVITSDIVIAARVFSVWGQLQLRAISAAPPNDATSVSLIRLGGPHPAGVCPLFYTVEASVGGPWLPSWDGPYRVFSDQGCVTLLATRESGEIYTYTAGAPVYVVQQAKL